MTTTHTNRQAERKRGVFRSGLRLRHMWLIFGFGLFAFGCLEMSMLFGSLRGDFFTGRACTIGGLAVLLMAGCWSDSPVVTVLRGLTLILFLWASWPVVHRGLQVDRARRYCESTILFVERWKADHGRFPNRQEFMDVHSADAPELLRDGSHNGIWCGHKDRSYHFSFDDAEAYISPHHIYTSTRGDWFVSTG